jgi:hypothetical protein
MQKKRHFKVCGAYTAFLLKVSFRIRAPPLPKADGASATRRLDGLAFGEAHRLALLFLCEKRCAVRQPGEVVLALGGHKGRPYLGQARH